MTTATTPLKTTTCTVIWCAGYGRDHDWQVTPHHWGAHSDLEMSYCLHSTMFSGGVRIQAAENLNGVGPAAVWLDPNLTCLEAPNLREIAVELLLAAKALEEIREDGTYTTP